MSTFDRGRPDTTTTGAAVSDWLAVRMAGRKMSRRQLAGRAGLSQSSISRILAGKSRPSWVTVARLVDALGDDPAGLLPGFPAPTPRATIPTRAVEAALRADPILEAADVKTLMRHYRDLRMLRLRLASGDAQGT